MSTITDLEASTSGSASLGIINTNFENLNTDKIEATQAVALTNKTIDGDLNTLQDIPYSALKSTSRTGLDTKIVTGTKGSANEVGMWNSDGDMVSSGVTLTELESAVDAASSSKELFIPVTAGNTVASSYDTIVGNCFPTNTPDSAENLYFVFKVPTGFSALTSAKVTMIPDATETIQYDLSSEYGASGEAYNNHTGSASDLTISATTSQLLEVNVASVLGSMAAGDYVGLRINSNTTQLRVIGLIIKYT